MRNKKNKFIHFVKDKLWLLLTAVAVFVFPAITLVFLDIVFNLAWYLSSSWVEEVSRLQSGKPIYFYNQFDDFVMMASMVFGCILILSCFVLIQKFILHKGDPVQIPLRKWLTAFSFSFIFIIFAILFERSFNQIKITNDGISSRKTMGQIIRWQNTDSLVLGRRDCRGSRCRSDHFLLALSNGQVVTIYQSKAFIDHKLFWFLNDAGITKPQRCTTQIKEIITTKHSGAYCEEAYSVLPKR